MHKYAVCPHPEDVLSPQYPQRQHTRRSSRDKTNNGDYHQNLIIVADVLQVKLMKVGKQLLPGWAENDVVLWSPLWDTDRGVSVEWDPGAGLHSLLYLNWLFRHQCRLKDTPWNVYNHDIQIVWLIILEDWNRNAIFDDQEFRMKSGAEQSGLLQLLFKCDEVFEEPC